MLKKLSDKDWKDILIAVAIGGALVIFTYFISNRNVWENLNKSLKIDLGNLKIFLSPILELLPTITVSILLFLLFRAVVLWYWKVDKVVKLLEEIVNTLKNK